jgi:hypothetical protein
VGIGLITCLQNSHRLSRSFYGQGVPIPLKSAMIQFRWCQPWVVTYWVVDITLDHCAIVCLGLTFRACWKSK